MGRPESGMPRPATSCWISSGALGPFVRFVQPGRRTASYSGRRQLRRVWDIETAKELMTCSRHTSQVNAAAYDADGTYIVTASGDNTAIVWDAKKGTPLHVSGSRRQRDLGGIQPERGASGDRQLRSNRQDMGREDWEATVDATRVTRAIFMPRHSAQTDRKSSPAVRIRTARVWDAKSGDKLLTLNGHTNGVTSASFSPDGNRI